MPAYKKILVSNIYSFNNKGDAAIVVAMLDDLRRQFPEARFTLSSYDECDRDKYGAFAVQPSTLKILRSHAAGKLPRLFYTAWMIGSVTLFKWMRRAGVRPYFLMPRPLREKARTYADADLVVACGGGYLRTSNHAMALPTLLVAYDCYLADAFSVPYVLYNQSVGPFHAPWHARLFKNYLKRAALVVCREELTYARMQALGLTNIVLSYDIAFELETRPSDTLERHGFRSSDANIGMTVRKWFSDERQSTYEREVAGFMDAVLTDDATARFYLMPQVIFSANSDDDRVVAERVASLVRDRERVHVISEDLDPRELKSLIGAMDYFFGTRMHSNIFAVSSGVKTAAIAYEPKTRGIMRMLELEDYVVDIEAVTAAKLLELYARLRADAGYGDRLRARLAAMRTAKVDLQSELAKRR